MGKGKRLKKKRQKEGRNFTKSFSDRLSVNFQKEIKNSEMWDQMVAEFGEERASELLKECKAEIKPGPIPNEGWDRSEDI